MPRVISDELYDQLMGCVQQQRLLGVMGMLEKIQQTSVQVEQGKAWGEWNKTIDVWLPKSEGEEKIYLEKSDAKN